MKKLFPLFLLVVLIGCTYQGEKLSSYLEDPRKFIEDPHYANYKDKRDQLESQYLQKEITYDEYMKKMRELDNTYTQEVQKRNDILSGSK